ncbi:MAG TPA: hypothetical protein VLB27_04455 [candidate division Zixibacteria bacterium]|nr:hypothetical protein [candidate division Zixibacteria bacterium]
MKKIITAVSLCALCALLALGATAADGKKATTAEKKQLTDTKQTSSPKSGVTTETAKPAAEVKTATATSTSQSEVDALLKQQGLTMEQIQLMFQQAAKTAQAPAAGEEINWQVLSGGGGSGSSTNFGLISVIGQTAVGMGSSTNYNINHGFLQDFLVAAGCCDTPGDFDNSGSYNIADVTAGIAYIFSGGPAAVCPQEADFDGSGAYNIADVTAGIAFIFSGGAAPICGP